MLILVGTGEYFPNSWFYMHECWKMLGCDDHVCSEVERCFLCSVVARQNILGWTVEMRGVRFLLRLRPSDACRALATPILRKNVLWTNAKVSYTFPCIFILLLVLTTSTKESSLILSVRYLNFVSSCWFILNLLNDLQIWMPLSTYSQV